MTNKFWPLAKGSFEISSDFGPRDGGFHAGMDFAAKKGVPFYSPGDGVCVEGSERRDVSGFGKWVWLDLQKSHGVDIIIGHGDPMVRADQPVKAGQLVGYVNSYGQSSGPHAHVEVWTPPGRIGGKAIDPAVWFKDAKYIGETSASGGVKMKDPTTRVQISPNKDRNDPRNVWWIAVHTQEGGRTAAGLVNFTCDPSSEVSYNAIVDDAETVLTVPWDWNPWSAGNANSMADHVCGAGTYAGWSRNKWLEKDATDGKNEDLELTRLAEVVAWRCLVRGIPPVYVGNHGNGPFPPKHKGICGHMDFGSWGGGHHDPGVNFPWDEFIRRVELFYKGGIMGFLEETLRNFKGNTVRVDTILYYLDQKLDEVWKQVATGWKQLGVNSKGEPLTLIDSQAAQTAQLTEISKKLDQIIDLQKKMKEASDIKKVPDERADV